MPLCSFCQQNVAHGTDRCPHCGAWLRQSDGSSGPSDDPVPSLDESLESEIRSLLSQNRKIEAIKVYRERTGAGLAEAKSAVEQFERGGNLSDSEDESIPGNVRTQLLDLLMAGQKIQAIKLYRQQTRLGLKESKEAVEALAAQNGIAPQRVGCLGVLVAMLAAVPVLLIGPFLLIVWWNCF